MTECCLELCEVPVELRLLDPVLNLQENAVLARQSVETSDDVSELKQRFC